MPVMASLVRVQVTPIWARFSLDATKWTRTARPLGRSLLVLADQYCALPNTLSIRPKKTKAETGGTWM